MNKNNFACTNTHRSQFSYPSLFQAWGKLKITMNKGIDSVKE